MAMVTTQNELKELYDKDFPLWAEINLNLLKEKKYDQVDWENLLEEIEDMSRADLKEAIHFLEIILEHLYKWDNLRSIAGTGSPYGEKRAGYDWIESIENSRIRIESIIEVYPSLKSKLPLQETVDKAWKRARAEVIIWLKEKGYDFHKFNIPKECPYTYEDAMNRDVRGEKEAHP